MTTERRPVTILFVCSANLCRSVTAAALARRAASELGASQDWSFLSAGTDVMPGQRLPSQTETAMRELGIPVGRRPRLVDEQAIRRADIVLTAERAHRAKVVERYPFAVRSTFTLLQFARLAAAGRAAITSDGSDELLDPVTLAQIGRTHVQALEDASIDITDPVRSATASAMLECASIIEVAVSEIVR